MTLPPSLTKILSRFRKSKSVKHKAEPSRDWLLALLLALVLLVVSVGVNTVVFMEAVSHTGEGEAPIEERDIDQSAVEKAKEAFGVRALEEAKYRSEYRFVDPSR